MDEKKNISTKKVARFAVGSMLVLIFMVALIAASRYQADKAIKGVNVHLNDDKEYSFLQRKDIEKLLLDNRHIDLARTSISKLDLKQMEAIARTHPWVANADIYVDNRQLLQVSITQREPLARIFDHNGASYYLDSTLHTMPAQGVGYAYAAPVFTNVPVVRNDSQSRVLYSKIAYMSKLLSSDSFWQAQITQIEVQPDQTFVLTPLFGNQRILAGDTSRMPEKLSHLFAFYKNVSGKIGWDKYETLDIRYKDQVIASPSIGWIPPRVSDTAAAIPEGPAPTANHGVVTPALAAAAATPARAKPAADTRSAKASVKAAVIKQEAIRKKTGPAVKPGEKTVAQASARKPEAKKDVKKNTKEKTPKYLYPGKQTGKH